MHFLHEDAIVQCIHTSIEQRLLTACTSRTFLTQTLLPAASQPAPNPNPSSGTLAQPARLAFMPLDMCVRAHRHSTVVTSAAKQCHVIACTKDCTH